MTIGYRTNADEYCCDKDFHSLGVSISSVQRAGLGDGLDVLTSSPELQPD
ncbi:MAG: hypothetical protein IPP48_06350 [Chitinophagaceae bacterium]|nr:hypothetical protein [Chitinophagaceae bacterium]